MTFKTKTPRLVNPIPIGGAPFFADDLLAIQENSKADIVNYFEYLKGLVTPITFTSPSTEVCKTGFLITEPTFDVTVPSATIVGGCWFYAEGEVLYFAGGTYDFSSASPSFLNSPVLYLTKGAATFENRVFEDAAGKDIKVSYAVDEFEGYISATELKPVGIDVNKEHVRIGPLLNTYVSLGVSYFQNRGNYPCTRSLFGPKNRLEAIEGLISQPTGLAMVINPLNTLHASTFSNAFRKISGVRILTGSVDMTCTSSLVLANIQAGLRPNPEQIQLCKAVDVVTGLIYAIKIDTSGDITVITQGPNVPAIGMRFFVSFDGITY
jgi:hypothetical protein